MREVYLGCPQCNEPVIVNHAGAGLKGTTDTRLAMWWIIRGFLAIDCIGYLHLLYNYIYYINKQ
jgi:hypothetical protein